METLSVPRILIAGTHAGVGKSFVTLGIAYELRRRGLGISCCVLGSRLAQAAILRRISGRYVRCLDERLLSTGQLATTLHQAGVGADIVLVDGQAGLYDGMNPGELRGSDAEFAALSGTPAVLVADASLYGASIAACVKGFMHLASGFEVVGTVLNHVQADASAHTRNRDFFEDALRSFGIDSLVGALPTLSNAAQLPGAELSQEKNQTTFPLQFFSEVGRLVTEHVDLDRLIALAHTAQAVHVDDYAHTPLGRRCRIAVSEDSCFALGFQDNLDLLRYFGAEVVAFSPLADAEIPRKTGAIYLTGAYLAEYGEELSRNSSMRASILEFAGRGGVVYSEAGGTAFLCRDFKPAGQDQKIEGVGLIPASAIGEETASAYYEAVTVEESILGRPGLIVKGVRTGEWRLANEERMVKALRLSRSGLDRSSLERPGSQMVMEGVSPGAQQLSTFCSFHFGSNPILAKNLADAAEVVKGL